MPSKVKTVHRTLDAEQKIDARQALGCGVGFARVAQHFGLTEAELRAELALPQWKTEPTKQQGSLFEIGGEE